MKKKPVYFRIPIIGVEYEVYVCVDTKEKALKKVNKYFEGYDKTTLEEMNVRGKTFYNPELHPFIFINIDIDNLLATVAHESFHAISYVLKYLGQDISDAEEVVAQVIGSIVKSVEKEMAK
jgi:Na+/phosphate symporter